MMGGVSGKILSSVSLFIILFISFFGVNETKQLIKDKIK